MSKKSFTYTSLDKVEQTFYETTVNPSEYSLKYCNHCRINIATHTKIIEYHLDSCLCRTYLSCDKNCRKYDQYEEAKLIISRNNIPLLPFIDKFPEFSSKFCSEKVRVGFYGCNKCLTIFPVAKLYMNVIEEYI